MWEVDSDVSQTRGDADGESVIHYIEFRQNRLSVEVEVTGGYPCTTVYCTGGRGVPGV